MTKKEKYKKLQRVNTAALEKILEVPAPAYMKSRPLGETVHIKGIGFITHRALRRELRLRGF